MPDPILDQFASVVRQVVREELIRAKNPEPDTMTIEEIAALARYNVATVRRHILAGKLKASRAGRKWLVKREDVAAYIGKR